MDDLICIEVRVEAFAGASIDMGHAVLRGVEALVVASVKIAVAAGGRAIRIPRRF